MRESLKEALEFGIYGVHMFSMPACGVHTLSDEDDPDDDDEEDENEDDETVADGELCLRWFQLAAFMPAMNSYYGMEKLRFMPYDLTGTYRDWVRRAIGRRYRLMPYLHTLMYEASATGVPSVRPLFMEFPDDYKAYDLYGQFMVGDSILVTPVLDSTMKTQIDAYIPRWTWYDLWSGQLVEGAGGWKVIEDIPYQIASHLRAGKIIPTLVSQRPTLQGL